MAFLRSESPLFFSVQRKYCFSPAGYIWIIYKKGDNPAINIQCGKKIWNNPVIYENINFHKIFKEKSIFISINTGFAAF